MNDGIRGLLASKKFGSGRGRRERRDECPSGGERSVIEGSPAPPSLTFVPGSTTLRDAERELIRATVAAFEGNVKAAAKGLGCSRSALYKKAKRHGLDLVRVPRTPAEPAP